MCMFGSAERALDDPGQARAALCHPRVEAMLLESTRRKASFASETPFR
jgi:hypothetical protein